MKRLLCIVLLNGWLCLVIAQECANEASEVINEISFGLSFWDTACDDIPQELITPGHTVTMVKEDSVGTYLYTSHQEIAGNCVVWHTYIGGKKIQTLPYTVVYGTTVCSYDIAGKLIVLSEPPASLPIELSAFAGKLLPEGIFLEWQTATESNNAYFTVERSPDGKDFVEIAIVDGAGNSDVEIEYNFLDKDVIRANANGNMYYRLKQTDFDGTYSYSEIIVIDLPKKSGLQINHIFSDIDGLSINFQNAVEEEIFIQIVNLSGQVIANEKIQTAYGLNQKTMSLHTARGQFFIVQISNGSQQDYKKVFFN